MSTVNLGKIAPFPPLPGQPYPPARNHPRWKELYRLNDEWMMKYWPFSSEKKRQRIPFMNLTGFSTWCAPAADFDRMVWGGIMASIFFLADDYVDSGRMFERIEGFKAAATGNGPLHPEDRAELCHDIVFRGIKATSHPRTFDQLTKCTHEWWDSNIHEPFKNLDQYLAVRRVNIAMYFANSYFRYTLDINLTDEQVNHPLMREAEGIVSDHVGLTNDFFSYAKEKLTQSDDTNILRILQDHEGLTFEEAKKVVEEKIREKERAYIPAGMAVLNHPELGKDPEVRRWIACLPYCMGGNMAWSQESGRYNIGDVPGGVPFPKLEYFPEPTPEDEIVDDTEETRRRDIVFNVEKEPEVDLALDIDEIESSAVQTKCASEIIVSNLIELPTPARPEHVGIVAIEPYIPGSTGTPHPAPVNSSDEVLESVKSIAWMTVSSMLKRFDIKHHQIGRVDVAVEASARSAKYVTDWLINTFRGYGNVDLEGSVVPNAQNGAVTAFTNACSWIESTAWDGRYALLYLGNFQGGTAVLLGPDAPLVLEPVRGNYFISTGVADPQKDYIGALQAAFDSYHWKRYNKVSQSVLGHTFVTDSATTFHGIDYLVYASSSDDVARVAHQNLFEKTHVSASRKAPTPVGADKDYEHRVHPSLSIVKTTGLDTLFSRVASIIDNVPSYDFFEKRVGLFDYGTRTGGTFLVLQVRGDTKYIRDKMDLANRLQAVTATSPAPLSPAQTPVGASPPSFKFEIQLTGGQQVIGAKVVPVA